MFGSIKRKHAFPTFSFLFLFFAFNELITDAQKHKIQKLAVKHWDELVAYGAEMYRKGLIKGILSVSVGFATVFSIMLGVELIKEHKTLKDSKETETQ